MAYKNPEETAPQQYAQEEGPLLITAILS